MTCVCVPIVASLRKKYTARVGNGDHNVGGETVVRGARPDH
jgi:hypothetical protein